MSVASANCKFQSCVAQATILAIVVPPIQYRLGSLVKGYCLCFYSGNPFTILEHKMKHKIEPIYRLQHITTLKELRPYPVDRHQLHIAVLLAE